MRAPAVVALALVACSPRSAIVTPPIPSTTTDVGAEERASRDVVASLCRAGVDAESHAFGCTCCAPFDACPPVADAPLADADVLQSLTGFVFGSFTRPGVREAFLAMHGCTTHAAFFGEGVLARFEKGRWRYVEAAIPHPDRCVADRLKSGRDVLVCSAHDLNIMNTADSIFFFDFGSPAPEGTLRSATSVYDAIDDAQMGCVGREQALPQEVVVARIDAWALRDVDGDGENEILVTSPAARGRVGAAFRERCAREGMPESPPREHGDFGELLPEHEVLKLVFRWDGATFRPTPDSAAKIRKFAQPSGGSP